MNFDEGLGDVNYSFMDDSIRKHGHCKYPGASLFEITVGKP